MYRMELMLLEVSKTNTIIIYIFKRVSHIIISTNGAWNVPLQGNTKRVDATVNFGHMQIVPYKQCSINSLVEFFNEL